ncbi:membrane protein [Staphylococcus schweitzeri]|nr:membrane protein [Staphylococcus schweitzeri]
MYSFIFAVIIIPRFLDLGTFDVTIALLFYIASIIIFGAVVGILILRYTLVWFGDQKITYVINVTYGIIVFLWMILGGLIIKKYPIYSFFELSDKQSFIIGITFLILVIGTCTLIKQKMYALIVLVISLPSLIARIASIFSKEPDTFNLVSVSILIILNIVFIIYTFVNYRKLKKED